MPQLPDFRLETHFSKWEFKARYHLCASDAQTLSLRELLAMATPDQRAQFDEMSLGYTQTYGAPDLRALIAQTYQHQSSDDILCFAGASEAIYAANHVLLDADSHAIVLAPNYQSHETLPLSICATSAIALDANDHWALDIDRLAREIRPNTRLLTINFPHNPTGAILSIDHYKALIELCRKHGIYILHDEIFSGLGPSGAQHLPFIADLYERGLSLNVMSKSYGLPGLRIGWIASQDHAILSKMERMKHYLSICNSGPSEELTKIALQHRDKILARNCKIIDDNLPLLDAFFAKYTDLFDWHRPDGSCMAYVRYRGADGVETFCANLLERAGVLLLPASIYSSQLTTTPSDYFRIGFGRFGLAKGLDAMETYLSR